MVLGIALEDSKTFRKYLAGLCEDVHGYLIMYPLQDIDDAYKKGTTVEKTLHPKKYAKTKGNKTQPNPSKPKGGSDGGGDAQAEPNKCTRKKCSHCKLEGHTEVKCWFAHPELAPKQWRKDGPPKGRDKPQCCRVRRQRHH